MKNKYMIHTFAVLLAVMLCMTAFSTVAFASDGDAAPTFEAQTEPTDSADVTGADLSKLISALFGSISTEKSGKTGTVTTNGGKLNVRTGAGLDNYAFTQLPNGTVVEVVGTDGDWYMVRLPEKIFRLVYQMADCHKPILRLWISSMEDSAIREGFSDLRPGADYEALYQSALCRQKADWLVGINATRLFSVLYHRTLNVGRVQTPTLAMLAERDAKITLFHKEKYHLLRLMLDGAEAVLEKFTDPAEAEQAAAMCKGAAVTCTSVTKEQKKEQPPKYKFILAAQDFFCKLHADLMGLFRRNLSRLKGLDQVAAQVGALVDGVAAGPGKFNICCFGGAAIGGYQELPICFLRVADIVNGRFQR